MQADASQPSQWLRETGQDVWMMGVLNCTPDSFSDGGSYVHIDAALEHGLQMWNDGAAIIDVGGESTRPGAALVSVEEELQRVMPVVRALTEAGCKVSIDTRKAEVMRQAVEAGACMINDVSALLFDQASLKVAADAQVDVCLMHMQGSPETMQKSPQYDDVLADVVAFFEQRIECCVKAGIPTSSLLLDPGIGFGKRLEDNLYLIANLDVLKKTFSLPVLLGVSRKSFLGMLTGSEVEHRELETALAGGVGVLQGADGVRVHDVKSQRKACLLASSLADARIKMKKQG